MDPLGSHCTHMDSLGHRPQLDSSGATWTDWNHRKSRNFEIRRTYQTQGEMKIWTPKGKGKCKPCKTGQGKVTEKLAEFNMSLRIGLHFDLNCILNRVLYRLIRSHITSASTSYIHVHADHTRQWLTLAATFGHGRVQPD